MGHRPPVPTTGQLERGGIPPPALESPHRRRRDTEIKRREYALAGIAEYWLVDPAEQSVTVLARDPDARLYAEHGCFQSGDAATSVELTGFAVEVATLFHRNQSATDTQ